MSELLTAAQMRAAEQAAIASGEVTGLELMERAGRGVIEAIFEEWPDLAKAPHRAVVLCGPGNNGGDGFVVARLLKEWGWDVDVFLYGDAGKLPPDARANFERWGKLGAIEDIHQMEPETYTDRYPDCVLAVDALFGTGLSRPFHDLGFLRDELNFWQADQSKPKVVAVDIPSGICSDSGRYLGYDQENPLDEAILANLTVTFQALRQGHHLDLGPLGCGKVVVKPIGVEVPSRVDIARSAASPENAGFSPLYMRCQKYLGHKFSYGHAVILAGGAGKGGAGRLAARGALRIGAGLVTLGCPPGALQENAAQLTAIMLKPLKDAEAFEEALGDERLNALCLGPGLGTERAQALVPAALAARRATVLDADALSAFADAPEDLFALLHDNCVLTPHAGEFARLFPDIADLLNAPATQGPAYSKVDATREAAKRAGCVVLFKGADTVIASPNGDCAIHSAHYDRAAPWLATAGSGDVLAGFITGLLARGFAPMAAAETAAWLHVECARSFGPGLIAEDLPEELPKVFRQLGLQ